jgi:hypothetical protein
MRMSTGAVGLAVSLLLAGCMSGAGEAGPTPSPSVWTAPNGTIWVGDPKACDKLVSAIRYAALYIKPGEPAAAQDFVEPRGRTSYVEGVVVLFGSRIPQRVRPLADRLRDQAAALDDRTATRAELAARLTAYEVTADRVVKECTGAPAPTGAST